MPHVRYQISGICEVCALPFTHTVPSKSARHRFCSVACAVVGNKLGQATGSRNVSWKGGVPQRSCHYCGVVFHAYDKASTTPRLFCSYQCANAAHRMTVFAMQDRVRYENELMAFLGGQGWSCMRSAGSRGPVDVYALNDRVVRMIQVKSTHTMERPGNLSVFKAAIKLLQTLPAPPNTTKELWVRVLRKGWFYIVLDDAPTDDAGLRAYLKKIDWVLPGKAVSA